MLTLINKDIEIKRINIDIAPIPCEYDQLRVTSNTKQIKHYIIRISTRELTGGRPVGYLQAVVELSSGLPKTNPADGREQDMNSDRRILSLEP